MSKYINHIVDILLIICWSFAQLLKKSPRKDSTRRVLCILELSGVGDTICATDALYNLWLNTRGKAELYIAAPKPAVHLLKTCKLALDAHWIELNIEGNQKFKFIPFRNNHKAINRYNWDCIIKMDLLSSYMRLLLLGCAANRIVGMEFSGIHHNLIDKLSKKLLRNLKLFYFPYDTFILEYNKVMIECVVSFLNHSSSDLPYKEYDIPVLDTIPLSVKGKRYCIVCPSVSTAVAHFDRERKWPLERFTEIVDFIIDNSDISIVVCGVQSDKADNDYIITHCKNPSRVIDMTGKTTFTQWIELIRNAVFLFGNDSGYTHLAAFLKTPSFVLAGYWNYGNFLPYIGNNVRQKTVPFNIRVAKPSCCFCNHRRVHDPSKTLCDELVKEKGIYKCAWDISVTQVEQKLLASNVLK
ncbi:glycosyltransferase family 9 protein [Mitsuokella sp.]|uniref:glycosyltransferase family 9 protein n=1 Tax=Mitsuokella sp. TaxID=2049034 RepID=UPI003D7D3A77